MGRTSHWSSAPTRSGMAVAATKVISSRRLKRHSPRQNGAPPAILLVDQVDSFPDRTMATHDHGSRDIQEVNSPLAEIDGVEGSEGVVLLAACKLPGKDGPGPGRSVGSPHPHPAVGHGRAGSYPSRAPRGRHRRRRPRQVRAPVPRRHRLRLCGSRAWRAASGTRRRSPDGGR
jgi:hypothetical protein